MKNILLILTSLFSISVLNSQTINFGCGKYGTPSPTGQVVPTTFVNASDPCYQLLSDFVPTSSDPYLEINVNFWVLAPSTNSTSGAWTNTLYPNTISDFTNCVKGANDLLANLQAPTRTVSGVNNITDAKIRFKIKNITFVNHTAAYEDSYNATDGAFGYNWHDPTAINVIMGIKMGTYTITTPTGTASVYGPVNGMIRAGGWAGQGYPVHYPDNTMQLSAQFGALNPTWDNVSKYSSVLVHEVFHDLGLNHTTNTITPISIPPYFQIEIDRSYIEPKFGCCTTPIAALDYFEDGPGFETCPGVINPYTNQMGKGSNNIMSQNTACGYQSLSPFQIALLHYNLRKAIPEYLTVGGYNAAFLKNSAITYVVTSNETWGVRDRFFKGDIRVTTGKTLKIKCTVAMQKGARIIVEPGAQLVIDGGHVTNIFGKTWQGIEVMGNPLQSQTATHPTNAGALLYQGIVRVINGGKISHADVAVKNNLGNGSYAGGVVMTDNAVFENNVRDLQLWYPTTIGNPLNNTSKLVRTKFLTTGSIGEQGIVPITHAELKNINGVQFLGCTFQFSTSAGNGLHGDGITSSDAVYYVTNFGNNASVFNGMYRGIYVNNVNPLKVPTITNTLFKEINGYGAYFLNTNYLAFQTNTIQSSANTYYYGGVYLNNCKYYKVKNNLFIQPLAISQQESALNIYRSKAGAHEVYRNIFSNVMVGINCMDDNSGLTNNNDGVLMNCNVFNQMTNLYDIALTYTSGLALPSVKTVQGAVVGYNAYNVVRNIYGANCGNENKWYVYSGSTKPIDHGANTNSITAVTQPSPQPACSSTLLNIFNTNISLDYPIHCSPNPLSSGGTSTVQTQRIANLNSYIVDLQANNPGNRNHFEIQSSVASKLYEFLSDSTATPMDSVINILTANTGNMADANVQLVFAYLANNDYVNASIKANQLPTDKIDWKNYLLKLIDIRQNPDGETVLCDNTDNFNYVATFADSENKDGQASAQALLKIACNREYIEPHALPEGEVSQARSFNYANINNGQNGINGDANLENLNASFSVFPNPTNSNFTIRIKSQLASEISFIITDLLGHRVKTGVIYNNTEQEIGTGTLKNGIYFLTLVQEGKCIGKEKLILMK